MSQSLRMHGDILMLVSVVYVLVLVWIFLSVNGVVRIICGAIPIFLITCLVVAVSLFSEKVDNNSAVTYTKNRTSTVEKRIADIPLI